MCLLTSEQLLRSSIHVSTQSPDGSIAHATAFFFKFRYGNEELTVLVSNRHVLDNSISLNFFLNVSPLSYSWEECCQSYSTKNFTYKNPYIITHPDPTVDLALFLMDATLNLLKKSDLQLAHWIIDESLIPTPEEWLHLSAMEELLMVGCPRGIFDICNNLPLMRKGITASHPAYDFNRKPIFISDIACFPGSSGSPIFSFDTSSCIEEDSGALFINPLRSKLLGIQSEVFLFEKNCYMNLAIAVKSSELLAFRPLLENIQKE